MCLAIPGKIVELDPQNAHLAVVDVVGVRRKVDLGLLQDEPPNPRGLGVDPRGVCDEQDQRIRGA